jgi:hypothetical protein
MCGLVQESKAEESSLSSFRNRINFALINAVAILVLLDVLLILRYHQISRRPSCQSRGSNYPPCQQKSAGLQRSRQGQRDEALLAGTSFENTFLAACERGALFGRPTGLPPTSDGVESAPQAEQIFCLAQGHLEFVALLLLVKHI